MPPTVTNTHATTATIWWKRRTAGGPRPPAPEIGRSDYRARYYDPALGKFVSEDPTRFNGGINFYRYAINDPVGLDDPMGDSPCLNVSNFVTFMNQQAKGKTDSGHNCAQAVKNGLNNGFGGKQGDSLHNGPQNYGPGLENLGFMAINNNSSLKPGDIMIFQPPGGNQYGHIQMWNGNNWVSDYVQPNRPDGYPGPGSYYKQKNPSNQLYRDPNICP